MPVSTKKRTKPYPLSSCWLDIVLPLMSSIAGNPICNVLQISDVGISCVPLSESSLFTLIVRNVVFQEFKSQILDPLSTLAKYALPILCFSSQFFCTLQSQVYKTTFTSQPKVPLLQGPAPVRTQTREKAGELQLCSFVHLFMVLLNSLLTYLNLSQAKMIFCIFYRLRKTNCYLANKFNLNVSPTAALLQWLEIANKTFKTADPTAT